MKVTICVATYKRPEGLKRLLEGLNQLEFMKSKKPSIEIVVVDNDSRESARSICEEIDHVLRWPLKYDIEIKRGISYVRNKAMKMAGEVDFIAFIDDDEVPDPRWLDELLFVQMKYHADVVTGPVIPSYIESVPSWVIKGKFYERPRYPTGYRMDCAGTGNVLIRYSLIQKMDMTFDERYAITGGSDTHFFIRLHRAGCKIIWSDEAIVDEWVPKSRVNVKWILQRAYRTGNTYSLVLSDLDDSFHIRFKQIMKASAFLLLGFIFLPLSVFGGRHILIKVLRTIFHGFGRLAGVIGIRYKEYRTTHNV
ncbi:glycosyl transferase family 2 [Melghirimyces profundicolus]|uniref:Glycosyl transferase family 2 n=1 Tax=Melghirimyces profundicolus TaxID=1242148 RepID=A0A2T6BCH3_9BACL|nr:glycosyltransferase family 2 protein [Melghirimyces profundicolus]PTX53732.1 glycosyl transferase family 2 [Melghirimyces profundicolus]